MAFCSNCGTQLSENSNFCPSCSAPVGQNAATSNTQSTPPPQQNVFQKINNTSDTTAEYDPKDIADNKVMAVLAYLGILVLIPMFAAPNSKYARFHARQGFTLFLAYIAYSIINFLLRLIKTTRYILGIPYHHTTPGIVVFIGWLIGIPLFILSIMGIINAYQGKAKELPVIGKIKILK
jgi:uncharacterized membrane protein